MMEVLSKLQKRTKEGVLLVVSKQDLMSEEVCLFHIFCLLTILFCEASLRAIIIYSDGVDFL